MHALSAVLAAFLLLAQILPLSARFCLHDCCGTELSVLADEACEPLSVRGLIEADTDSETTGSACCASTGCVTTAASDCQPDADASDGSQCGEAECCVDVDEAQDAMVPSNQVDLSVVSVPLPPAFAWQLPTLTVSQHGRPLVEPDRAPSPNLRQQAYTRLLI